MSGTRDVHVGTPAADYQLDDSVTVHFHSFEKLTTVKGEAVFSPIFTCAGSEWCLVLYPGGNDSSREGWVAVHLCNESSEKIRAAYDISVMKSCGNVYRRIFSSKAEKEFDFEYSWGKSNAIRHSDILNESNNILNKGTLTFFLRIKPNKDYYCLPVKSQSMLTLGENISKIFGEESTADMAFEVDGTLFYAHKLILGAQAPDLLELVEQFSVDNPMPIKNVEPEIFEMMLKHVYGKGIRACEWKKYSKQILVASGKYGLSELKLEAEAWHVKNLNLNLDNAVEELLFADGSHCLDFKKAVLEFIVENGEGVLESLSFAKLAESTELMKEVMMEMAKSNTSKKRKLDELSPSS